MKDEILLHLNDAKQLEKLYRTNKVPFKRAFGTIYPQIKGNPLADFWNERLTYETDEISWGTRRELFLVIVASLLAGVIAKLPALLPLVDHLLCLEKQIIAWKNCFYSRRNTRWLALYQFPSQRN